MSTIRRCDKCNIDEEDCSKHKPWAELEWMYREGRNPVTNKVDLCYCCFMIIHETIFGDKK